MKKIIFLFLILIFPINLNSQEIIKVPNLKKEVKIYYDYYGIPHIYSKTNYDLYFAQGYVTAKDRLFQMDFLRRTAQGRISEILGKEKINSDYEIRKLGLVKVCSEIYKNTKKELKEALQAYADGVNYFININKDSLPPEFKILNYRPEPWKPVDCLLFGRLMVFHLSASLGEEIGFAKLIKEIGEEMAYDLYSGEPADPITIVNLKKQVSALPDNFKPIDTFLVSFEDRRNILNLNKFIGSNNWVISGEKSKSGFPILCNDPHLGLTNPSIWYDIHLNGVGINVIGSTFPGTPGVIIGHNERIAWGVTTTGYDVSDIYVEKINPKNPDEYQFGGKYLPLKKEKIKIKYKTEEGMAEVEKTIKWTIHGPIMIENIEGWPNFALSFRWVGFEPTYEVECFFQINRAKNLKEFKNALNYFGVGAQNFIYADVEGNIFYKAPAKVPIRDKSCLPYLPLIGWSGECEWKGFIPYDELPSITNPTENFIITANNRPISEDYKYYIGFFFDKGFRAKRIEERLTSEEKYSFREVQSIQGDIYSKVAETLRDLILDAAEKKIFLNEEKEAIKILKAWDLNTSPKNVASSIFHTWLKFVSINVLKDDLQEEVFKEVGGINEVIIGLLLRSKKDKVKFNWFDDKTTGKIETKDEIIIKSLKDALLDLKKRFGEDKNNWDWGNLHTLNIRHPVISEWNWGPYPAGGSIDTVNNAGFNLLGSDFSFSSGPSLRMCTEVRNNLLYSENVIPGGQSSNPENPHYQDQLDLWLQNKARPLFFKEEEITKNLEKVIILKP